MAPRKQPQPRLTKNSKAVKLLRNMFQTGELSGEEDPRKVWLSNDEFKKHKLVNFKSCFSGMTEEFGENLDDEEDEILGTLNPRCSSELEEPPQKKKRLGDGSSGGSDALAGFSGVELISGELQFKPLYAVSEWVERPSMTGMVNVAILLPSVVGPEDFSIRVPDGGDYLELSVSWPTPLLDVEELHKKWLEDPSTPLDVNHGKLVGFEKTLKRLREKCSDKLSSTARIPLPFTVQTHIFGHFNLCFRRFHGARIVYLELRANVSDYGNTNNSKPFEII